MESTGNNNSGFRKYVKILTTPLLKQTLHYIRLCFTLSKTVHDSCTFSISNIIKV